MNYESGKNRLSLRSVAADDSGDMRRVEELHMELLGFGPMAGLGGDFVREICYRNHMQSGLLWVTLAEIDGELAGLVAITPYSASFHREGLSHHFLSTVWQTLWAILRRPDRLGALFRALRVLGSRRDEIESIGPTTGEVVCVAVRPQFLTPAVTKDIGTRLSQRLVQHGADGLSRLGATSMRMLVGEDNRAALMLYHLMGAEFEPCELGGEPYMQVSFELDGESSIPAVWRQSVDVAGAPSDWSEYWNTVSSKPRVFKIEAADYAERLSRNVDIPDDAIVLDFGCGFGFVARQLATMTSRTDLWDQASYVRRQALHITAGIENIRYVDLSSEEGDPESEYDAILVHSVIQYMDHEELKNWLRRWRRMLRRGAQLIVSDVMQDEGNPGAEVARLMRFAAGRGFLIDAFISGVRESARYFRARGRTQLTANPREEFAALAEKVGFGFETLRENLSYRSERYTVRLTPNRSRGA